MPKRSCSPPEVQQAIKNQKINKNGRQARKIRSASAERTLQLLFEGAKRQFEPMPKNTQICPYCNNPSTTKCDFCEESFCSACIQQCEKCFKSSCTKCSSSKDSMEGLKYCSICGT